MNEKKFKVLWLCSTRFTTEARRSTGTWTQPLAEQLNNSGRCEVCNITFGRVASVQKELCNGIIQYMLPMPKSIHGKASLDVSQVVSRIEQEVRPDIVHIWGTETIFASIYAQGYIKAKTLIDIQGLLYIYISLLRWANIHRPASHSWRAGFAASTRHAMVEKEDVLGSWQD